jgi:hypothetical protein
MENWETFAEFMMDERTKKFRDLCRELRLEAEKNNFPRDIVFAGVSWDFPTLFRDKIIKGVENVFKLVPEFKK